MRWGSDEPDGHDDCGGNEIRLLLDGLDVLDESAGFDGSDRSDTRGCAYAAETLIKKNVVDEDHLRSALLLIQPGEGGRIIH